MQDKMNEVLGGLGISGTCIRAETHRHLAFFDIALDRQSSSLHKLERSTKEIALHLRTKTVPILRLVPELGIVRLQAALREADIVPLWDLYNGQTVPNMTFPFLLGEDDEGKRVWMDMIDNPHLIISGSTGSGKSTLVHTLIGNALCIHALRFRNVWIYLNDPKRVEFTEYKADKLNRIVRDVASTYEETVDQLEFLRSMMEERYKALQGYKMRSIEEDPVKFPLVLCIVDEVSDLMLQDKKDGRLQDGIIKLAQKGRACGIFLVLATQRPSVDVITGLIKANFPGRIACKTASRKDSEVILDRPGAETLLGRGDAIMKNMKLESCRFQVGYTTPEISIEKYEFLKEYKRKAS